MNKLAGQRWFLGFGNKELMSIPQRFFPSRMREGPAAPGSAPIPPHSGAAPFDQVRLAKLLDLRRSGGFVRGLPSTISPGLRTLAVAERGRLHGVSRPGDARALADRLACHCPQLGPARCLSLAAELAEALRDWPLLLVDQALRAGCAPDPSHIRTATRAASERLWARLDRLDALLELEVERAAARGD